MVEKSSIVTLVAGQPVTTTPAIADGTHVDHASVIRLVRTYRADLEEFGGVGFEIQPFETAGGTQQREIACLNEQQATLLMTYMRNNDVVRDFKKKLVKAFWEMSGQASRPSIPQTLAEALRLAADQAEALEAAQPKIEFVDRYVDTTGSKGFRQVCKLLHANENRFREFLLDHKIMYRLGGEWVPYQEHIDAGRFEVKAGVARTSDHAFNQARFTPKGVQWVAGLWVRHHCEVAA